MAAAEVESSPGLREDGSHPLSSGVDAAVAADDDSIHEGGGGIQGNEAKRRGRLGHK